MTPATLLAPVALLVVLALLQGALALGPAGGPAMLVATRVVDSALWLAGIWLAMRLIELLIWDRLLPHWLGLRAPRLLRASGQRTPFIGTVQEVNWRSTGLLTPEDNLGSVPSTRGGGGDR